MSSLRLFFFHKYAANENLLEKLFAARVKTKKESGLNACIQQPPLKPADRAFYQSINMLVIMQYGLVDACRPVWHNSTWCEMYLISAWTWLQSGAVYWQHTWVCVCHRGNGSYRSLQLHIDLSLLIGWCKCLSTILSPLLLTRHIAVISTSSCPPPLSDSVCVLLSFREAQILFIPWRSPPSFHLLPRSPFLLFSPSLHFTSFLLSCIFVSRLFRPYLNWARAREESILSDPCRCVFCQSVCVCVASLKVWK